MLENRAHRRHHHHRPSPPNRPPVMSTFPLPPTTNYYRKACIYCYNAINVRFRSVVDVSGDNHAIINTFVDNGVISPEGCAL